MTNFEPQLELKPLPKIPLPQGWSDLVLLALFLGDIKLPTSWLVSVPKACFHLYSYKSAVSRRTSGGFNRSSQTKIELWSSGFSSNSKNTSTASI